ncbi:hypothetical protein Tco_1387370, partial [Tanacetum coccineum]
MEKMVDITVETTGEDGGYHGGDYRRRRWKRGSPVKEQYGGVYV